MGVVCLGVKDMVERIRTEGLRREKETALLLDNKVICANYRKLQLPQNIFLPSAGKWL